MPYFGCLPAVDDTGTFFPGSSGATGQRDKNNKKNTERQDDRFFYSYIIIVTLHTKIPPAIIVSQEYCIKLGYVILQVPTRH